MRPRLLPRSLHDRKLVIETTRNHDDENVNRSDGDRLDPDCPGDHLLCPSIGGHRVGLAQKKKPQQIIVYGDA
jgi:hypothetical protein